MDFIRRMLRLARDEPKGSWSKEAKGFEANALSSIRGLVEFWADENDFRGNQMKGQDLVRWKKEVYSRIQELNEIFQEDEKLRKEGKE
jgi:hypothetical protein